MASKQGSNPDWWLQHNIHSMNVHTENRLQKLKLPQAGLLLRY